MMLGVLILAVGIVSAVMCIHFRRSCSLVFEQHDMSPPAGRLLGFSLGRPTVCFVSRLFFAASALCFLLAIILIAVWGLCIVSRVGAQSGAIEEIEGSGRGAGGIIALIRPRYSNRGSEFRKFPRRNHRAPTAADASLTAAVLVFS
jgi:hypothetical protein